MSPAHQLCLSQLAICLRHSRQILAAWDAYSDQHSDPETFQPYDDAYGLRQQQRDADTLSAFGRVYYYADELVHVAEQQPAQPAGMAPRPVRAANAASQSLPPQARGWNVPVHHVLTRPGVRRDTDVRPQPNAS
ncbi:hypothetical protein AB0N06_23585 [Streptomyces sp. NPDC051020]|uniref:hypothetical protein n=1 Tax=Streptomyces sp. NPDC051020 TaxID=3155409 RepID=UPI00341B42A4